MPTKTAYPERAPTPHYRKGQGEPLLLLHPFASTWRTWRPVADLLHRELDVFAPTLPGHWGGPAIKGRLTPDAIVDGVERLLDAQGWESAHVAGNSLGGAIAIELARRGRARTVTAVAPAGGWKPRTWSEWRVGLFFLTRYPVLVAVRPIAEALMHLPTLRKIALFDACANGDRVHASDAAHFVHAAVGCEINPALLWSVLRDGFSFPLDGVNCPVQLLLCEQDRVIPPARYGRRFVEEIPNVAAETLPDVGHVPMVEAPEVIAAAIRRHVGARAM